MKLDVPVTISSRGKRLAAIAVLVVPVLLLFLFHPDLNRARQVGGVDEGRLFLAGATAILQGSDFPLTQRTPLYSLLLAAVGRAAGVQPDVLTHGAREYGSIEDTDVAEGFVKPRFQKMMLWVQAGLWLLSVLVLYRTAESLGLPFGWTFAILAVYVALTWLLATYIYDPVLTQFLLALGFFALVRWYRKPESTGWILLSAFSFSLSALSRPTFQLLVPCLVIVVWIVFRMTTGAMLPAKVVVVMMSVWLLIVGGYSLRNYVRNGFFGVSCAYGLSLTGRAAPFLEKAQDKFPEEVTQFLKIRDVDG
ncbi:MAG TPA: hypothetical protein VLR94_07270, partial [Acidobacteriota bacterium]|nr:hypothetical protein [Acidobacteriota bacterium]